MTCQSIVAETLVLGLEKESEKHQRSVWLSDVKSIQAFNPEAHFTCRYILKQGLLLFPKKSKLWNCLVEVEKSSKSGDELQVLKEAMQQSGKDKFALQYSKQLPETEALQFLMGLP